MRLISASLGLAALMAGVFPDEVQSQERPEYTIHRADTQIVVDGRLDEQAWAGTRDAGEFVFPWYESGKMEQTVAKLLWDDTHLYAAFICEDAYIWAVHTERNSRVWLDDAVEVFVAPDPDRPLVYFNIEMNARGVFLDQFRPDGPGTQASQEWSAEGIQIKTTMVGTLNDDSDADSYWILEVAIPFSNFAGVARKTPPRSGDVWHLNLNRLGGNTNNQRSQWSPSLIRPNFHTPEDFGRVVFADRPGAGLLLGRKDLIEAAKRNHSAPAAVVEALRNGDPSIDAALAMIR